MIYSGESCQLALVDVNNDGRKEAHISFLTRQSTTDWVYAWDGQQLSNLTPMTVVGRLNGAAETDLRNASFLDLDGDGVLEVYSFSQPPIDGSAPAASDVFRLSGGRFVIDRSVITLLDFERTSGAPKTDVATVLLPIGAQGPYTLRVINGAGSAGAGARVEDAVQSGRVWLNGQEIVRPNDFGNQVAVIERTVSLQADNELKVRLAGAPGGRITIVIDAASWMP